MLPPIGRNWQLIWANWLNNLECYNTQSTTGSSGTNTLAYWTHSLVMKEMKCCKNGSCGLFILCLWLRRTHSTKGIDRL